MSANKKNNILKDAYVSRTEGFIDVSKKQEAWKSVAEESNGKFTIGRTVDNTLEILRIEIPYKERVIKISESDTRPLKFEVELKLNKIFEIHISKEDSIDKFFKIFGKQDIIVGDDDFDDMYLIQSNEPELLQEVLSDEKIRNLMLTYDVYSLNCQYNKKEETHKLLFVVNRTTGTKEPLLELIDLQKSILDKFEELGL